MTHWKRSVPYILILFHSSCHANQPIILAKPYPFNRSESSRIECFSNDQSVILSLTILATMLDTCSKPTSFQSMQYNITRNGSIILNIPSPFNYSQLNSQIECRAKYYHGEQKVQHLDVLSVVEIPEKELVIINTKIKQMLIIHCLIYGSNVSVQWTFGKVFSLKLLDRLPIGIHLDQRFTRNDTLIIDHVSYIDHHGYYQCSASNQLFNRIYEDHTVFYLNVKKNSMWIFILIGCLAIAMCFLILILYSKYCRRK